MNSPSLNRRSFLGKSLGTTAAVAGAAAADMTLLNTLAQPTVAAELKKQQKSVILLWLAGGASQLETFDPKPGRATGGPYRAINTSVPGVQISELMPKMATRMRRTPPSSARSTRRSPTTAAARR